MRPLRFTRSRDSERAARSLAETMARRREEQATVIKTSSEVKVYEVKGKEIEGLKHPKVVVFSHWNRDNLITLGIADANGNPICDDVTVVAGDLIAAINNATNINRHG